MTHGLRLALVCAALSPLGLAGCVVSETTVQPAPTCGAAGLQGLVGQHRSVLATMTFPAQVRVIEPGTTVTMEYSPNRLNIETDASGRIVRVYCG